MDVFTFSVWTVGTIGVLSIALVIRNARKRPTDPEESIKLLLGPRGMAVRDYNQAATQANRSAQILEAVVKAANEQRAKGNIEEAQKLDAYARTVRARVSSLDNVTNPNHSAFRKALRPELKPYLTQLCKLHATTDGFSSPEATIIGQDIYNRYGHQSMIAVHDDLRRVLGAAPARDLERQWGGIGEWLG
ncbi:MAG TPA: hypothetical protein VGQ76_16725 [Thermoanaerobaculia bacterium]|jgi:hypothetical protein|nr:hypothetical protein [Thermoanaerobaculia bacterium]